MEYHSNGTDLNLSVKKHPVDKQFFQSFISIIFILLILLTYFVLRPWSLVSGRDMKPRLKILRFRVLYCSFILLV